MTKNIFPSRNIRLTALILIAISALTTFLLAKVPVSNPAGTTMVRVSTETDSGSSQINAAGAIIEIVGAGETSIDTENTNGIVAFVGHLDPSTKSDNIPNNVTPVNPGIWKLYD